MSYANVLTLPESLSKGNLVPLESSPLISLLSEVLNEVLKLLDVFDRTKLALTCRHFASFGTVLGSPT